MIMSNRRTWTYRSHRPRAYLCNESSQSKSRASEAGGSGSRKYHHSQSRQTATVEDALSKFFVALPKAAEVDKMTRQVMEQTRTLTPLKPNDDGTFTYVSLADPALPDPSAYDTLAILKKVMPEAEAEKLTKQFEDATVGQQILILRQWPTK